MKRNYVVSKRSLLVTFSFLGFILRNSEFLSVSQAFFVKLIASTAQLSKTFIFLKYEIAKSKTFKNAKGLIYLPYFGESQPFQVQVAKFAMLIFGILIRIFLVVQFS